MAKISRITSNILADRRYLYVYAQRAAANVHLRDWLRTAESFLLPYARELDTKRAMTMGGELFKRGYTTPFQYLTAQQVSALKSRIEALPLRDPYRPQHGQFFINNVPEDTHIAQVDQLDSARIPGVMDLANNPDFLGAMQMHFSGTPTLDYIDIWWSFPGHDAPEEAQAFHRDFDALSFLKLFVHLTDVDEDCGPHVYISGSHRHNVIDESLRRRSDEAMVSEVGQDRVVRFTGPAGMAFLENTFGFHKGQLPKKKRRLMMQFIYSVKPTVYGPVYPFLKRKDFQHLDRFINRRFVL